jgi:hypothetical protein
MNFHDYNSLSELKNCYSQLFDFDESKPLIYFL